MQSKIIPGQDVKILESFSEVEQLVSVYRRMRIEVYVAEDSPLKIRAVLDTGDHILYEI